MRIVFMGTPDFAVASLDALLSSGKHEIVGVITQPDRPKGRGNQVAFPDVKVKALEAGLPVYQPTQVKDEAFMELLKSMRADVAVVVAYGRILPAEVLAVPRFGSLNVHGSLLPAYRGAAPIQRAVLNGDRETGVTIMQMDAGMDTGDVLSTKVLPITDEDTTGTMFDRLAVAGGELLLETLDALESGRLHPMKQDEAKATYAARILKEDEAIDWTKPAEHIFHQIRGLAPAPGAYTYYHDLRIKIWRSRMIGEQTKQIPGTVVNVTKEGFTVQTGTGCLEIMEVQPAGKRAMAAKDFCNGSGLKVGMQLGEAHA